MGVSTTLLIPIQLHVESQHPEGGESPFIIKEDASIEALVDLNSSNDGEYIHCPIEGCGEDLLPAELESHIEMHKEEQDTGDSEVQSSRSSKRLKIEPHIADSFDIKLSHALRNLDDGDDRHVSDVPSLDRHATSKAAWKKVLKMPDATSRATSTSKAPTRRRLGVSPSVTYSHHVILTYCRNRNWALTRMRSRCLRGLSNF